MDENNSFSSKDLSKAFEYAINMQGHGFQYSVAKSIEDLHANKNSPWYLSVAEFPVEVQGYGTRVDLILKHLNHPLYIVAECKRANPALSDWCFAKASYIHPIERALFAFVERVQEVDRHRSYTSLANLYQSDNIYHIAIEVKTGKKGDRHGTGRGQFEKASTQVCRGLNGLIQLFHGRRNSFGEDHMVGFLPVIFTTASIFTSSVLLSDADLDSGNISFENSKLERKDWIFFHYHQSPGLKHSVPSRGPISDLRDTLFNEYVRTVAIVNSRGIDNFLLSGVFQ